MAIPFYFPNLDFFVPWLVDLFFTSLFAIALARQCLLHAHLFAWLHVVRVPLDFLDDVFLLHFALEAT